jgi:HNH endonuclease/AP2 domain
MKEIVLSDPDYIAQVDDGDYPLVEGRTWHTMANGYTRYAYAWNPHPVAILMHRVIMQPPSGMAVHHIDRNGLNNRRANLRIVTYSQNVIRSGKQDRLGVTSQYKGVHFEDSRKKWKAMIMKDGKRIFLGRFADEIEAALAYDRAALELYGAIAYVNFGEEVPE